MTSPFVPEVALPPGLAVPTGRTLIMGILNMTPDSFSDGGKWVDPAAAVDHALAMVEAGADLIDIGGESTRPGSQRIDAAEEWQRIGATVKALSGRGLVISVDTVHSETALRAAEAGAAIINDISGGLMDERMNAAVASTDCAYIVQRFHALPGTPEETFDHGDDVVATVANRLNTQVEAALRAGVSRDRIIVDPGLGFSLNTEQCWQIVGEVQRLTGLGYPVLIGASRKRFLALSPESDRDLATAQVTRRVSDAGVWAVRVHNVSANAAALRRHIMELEGGGGYGRQA